MVVIVPVGSLSGEEVDVRGVVSQVLVPNGVSQMLINDVPDKPGDQPIGRSENLYWTYDIGP